ncbi:hypothetical protein ACIBBB_25310 [Streptomyces sp. NPDC051217]|uniref:hypothetical protein n=1 Tax=Streptomyces sp. NPDC051217 TaxID=3365644 RepID=UPI00378BC1BE
MRGSQRLFFLNLTRVNEVKRSGDETGQHQAGRDYRLVTSPELPCGIYLQGGTGHTRGLTSWLLSHIAVRSGEIADSIIQRRAEHELGQDLAQETERKTL